MRVIPLLRTVLEESQRVALVRYTMRTTRMAVLRVMGNVLVLQNLTWPDEVRPADFAILAQKVVLKPRAIKVAHQIVESMLGVFDANDWTDTYTQRLTEVITAKALNTEASPVEHDAPEDVSDLIAALEASVKPRKKTRRSAK